MCQKVNKNYTSECQFVEFEQVGLFTELDVLYTLVW